MRTFKLIVLAAVVCVIALGYTVYRVQESRVARGVTIIVLTNNNVPIPHTFIMLEAAYEKSSIHGRTNERGELFFGKLTTGTYLISTGQISCDGWVRRAKTMTTTIQESNSRLVYFPCG
jgi:hypothetical protein